MVRQPLFKITVHDQKIDLDAVTLDEGAIEELICREINNPETCRKLRDQEKRQNEEQLKSAFTIEKPRARLLVKIADGFDLRLPPERIVQVHRRPTRQHEDMANTRAGYSFGNIIGDTHDEK